MWSRLAFAWTVTYTAMNISLGEYTYVVVVAICNCSNIDDVNIHSSLVYCFRMVDISLKLHIIFYMVMVHM